MPPPSGPLPPPPPGAAQPYPHPPHPHQPWPPGYGGPHGSRPPVNGLAIAALVLGLLCFLPFVGLVLGIVALAQIRRRGERGRGMAVSGIALSAAGTLLLVAALATGGARSFWEGFEEAARADGGTFSVDVGECFDAPGGSLEGYTYDVDTVPCEGKHDGEVFAVFDLPGGDWPGDDEVGEAAAGQCYVLADAYIMDSWAWPSDVDVYYFQPTRQSWGLGDREISCVFGSTDAGKNLTGSLRADGTTLDADQLAYLEADAVLYEALLREPADHPVDEALEDYKDWASEVDAAIGEQIGMLRGHDWPTDLAGPVAGHVQALESARAEWARAALATDADTYYEHYDAGFSLFEGARTVTAREALGLAATPPVYADESSEGYGAGDDGAGGLGTEV
ncbi:membrane protein [Streptomyces ruber]|uniref:Membrane protein n=2 Tax=Streptomyces TaxID=1883 RepID=A0A918EPD9_9ACTN|nr:DUF4190 domain-containing protein [Streptomyces ruber]GGQ41291.1 membrane protein [Streptomyces ruber]